MLKGVDWNVAECYVDSKHFATYNLAMTSEDIQTNLRLPADLKERLKQAAEVSNRSMNAEVVARLEESFAAEKGATGPIDDRTLDLFADTVASKVVQALDEMEKKRAKR